MSPRGRGDRADRREGLRAAAGKATPPVVEGQGDSLFDLPAPPAEAVPAPTYRPDDPEDAPDVWDASVPPGGMVCSVCRTPTESEPCREHQPDRFREALADAGAPDPDADCNCIGDGDWHPVGSGGCEWAERRIEDVHLPEYVDETGDLGPDPGFSYQSTSELADEAELIRAGEADALIDPDPPVVFAALDVCTLCLGEIAFRRALQGMIWRHTSDANDDHDVRTRWDPETTGYLHLPVLDIPNGERSYGLGEQGPQLVPWRDWRGPDRPVEVTRPGVYQLTADEYLSDPVPGGSLSNSGARRLILPSCPAIFRYEQDHGVRKTSDAFDLGHVWHREVLGDGVEIAVFPEHDARTKEGKVIRKAWNDARAAGQTPITEENYQRVQDMAAALFAHPYAAALLGQPARNEQSLFWRDPATGVVRRAMLDVLPDGAGPTGRFVVVDCKSADEVAPDDKMMRALYNYGYHRQGATYLDAVIELGLADDPAIVFLFQMKTPPYLVTPVELDARALQIGRIENAQALRVYAECVETGVWPGFTDGVETVSLPRYIEMRFED